MPIHNWTLVRAGVFHDFHQEWAVSIKRALNGGILPPGYYAMVEQASLDRFPDVITAVIESDPYAQRSNRVVAFDDVGRVVAVIEIVSPGNKSSRAEFQAFVQKALTFLRSGVHLLVVDLFPPTARDPNGMHAATWSEMIDYDFQLSADKPLIAASYSAGMKKRAFVEPLRVDDVLPAMPLFLEAETYVPVPLEATYMEAFGDVPKPYREKLSPSAEA